LVAEKPGRYRQEARCVRSRRRQQAGAGGGFGKLERRTGSFTFSRLGLKVGTRGDRSGSTGRHEQRGSTGPGGLLQEKEMVLLFLGQRLGG